MHKKNVMSVTIDIVKILVLIMSHIIAKIVMI